MSLIVREITAADVENVVATEAACFHQPWNRAAVESAISGFGFCGLVAEEDGVFCGYLLGLCIFETAEVCRIAVRQTCRGRGVGGRILNCFLETAKQRNAEQVFLEVRVSNASAISLYKSRGFEISRIREKYYENVEDAFEMLKRL
ncbi:MAG: ribosomal protein S18-alanine N-acetyltransferase [Clostridia bacterium]|nr:ribosomal protein S18-alanine N-acetyltransferase [Clostridia bacterium]